MDDNKLDKTDIMEFHTWNRKIINSYWVITIITLITEIVILFINYDYIRYPLPKYVYLYMIKPTVINVILLLIAELMQIKLKKNNEVMKLTITLCATLLAANIVMIHFGINVIFVIFIFPIFITVLYGSKRLTIITTIINIITYSLIYFLYLPMQSPDTYSHSSLDYVTILAMMLTTVVLSISIIDRAAAIVLHVYKLGIKQQKMKQELKLDQATGLLNHKAFYEFLEHEITNEDNETIGVAIFDIDGFKKVNDTYGHSVGDEIIINLASIIKGNIDQEDYAARYGGEEFTVIFLNKDINKAYEIVESIRKDFNNLTLTSAYNQRFSLSAGLSYLNNDSNTAKKLFQEADKALYVAKKTGKNKSVII